MKLATRPSVKEKRMICKDSDSANVESSTVANYGQRSGIWARGMLLEIVHVLGYHHLYMVTFGPAGTELTRSTFGHYPGGIAPGGAAKMETKMFGCILFDLIFKHVHQWYVGLDCVLSG